MYVVIQHNDRRPCSTVAFRQAAYIDHTAPLKDQFGHQQRIAGCASVFGTGGYLTTGVQADVIARLSPANQPSQLHRNRSVQVCTTRSVR